MYLEAACGDSMRRTNVGHRMLRHGGYQLLRQHAATVCVNSMCGDGMWRETMTR
jgi:hypothetical protein